MRKFSVSLLFKSYHSIPSAIEALWEDVIIFVQADNEEEAVALAKLNAVSRETEYLGEGEDVVTWKFEKIESICEIEDDPMKNGTELFSRFLKDSEAQSILQKFD